MADLTPNMPEVVSEVRELFESYERALADKNVKVLDATVWRSPYAIRYTPVEDGYSYDKIHTHELKKGTYPFSRSLCVALLSILTLVVSANSRAQQPVAPQGVYVPRIATEREPAVQTIEVRGFFSPFSVENGRARFQFRYRAPDEYELLVALDAPGSATVMAVSGRTAMIYDATRSVIVIVRDSLPTLSIGVNNRNITAGWGISTIKSGSSAPNLVVDFPAILQHPSIQHRDLETLGGGRHRLVLTSERGNRIVGTVDTRALFAFTDVLVENGGRQFLNWTMLVNQEMAPLTLLLPSIDELRKHFTVHEMKAPESMQGVMRLLGSHFVPFAISSADGRKFLEQLSENKLDWDAIQAALERDLPKLRQLFPLPTLSN